MNTREDEPGGDRLSVWTVAEGDGLGAVALQSGDQLTDRLCVAVWAQSCGPSAVLFLAGRDSKRGALLEYFCVRPDTQHVFALGLIKAITQPGVSAIGVIAEHRCLGHFPATGALDQLDPELRLGLESNPLGDPRLAPALLIGTPVLGQIQRPPKRHRPFAADRMHRHPDLTVAPLSQRPRVLTLDTWGNPSRPSGTVSSNNHASASICGATHSATASTTSAGSHGLSATNCCID